MRIYCVTQPCLVLGTYTICMRQPGQIAKGIEGGGQFILSLCHHGLLLWLCKQNLFFMLPWQQLAEFKWGRLGLTKSYLTTDILHVPTLSSILWELTLQECLNVDSFGQSLLC